MPGSPEPGGQQWAVVPLDDDGTAVDDGNGTKMSSKSGDEHPKDGGKTRAKNSKDDDASSNKKDGAARAGTPTITLTRAATTDTVASTGEGASGSETATGASTPVGRASSATALPAMQRKSVADPGGTRESILLPTSPWRASVASIAESLDGSPNRRSTIGSLVSSSSLHTGKSGGRKNTGRPARLRRVSTAVVNDMARRAQKRFADEIPFITFDSPSSPDQHVEGEDLQFANNTRMYYYWRTCLLAARMEIKVDDEHPDSDNEDGTLTVPSRARGNTTEIEEAESSLTAAFQDTVQLFESCFGKSSVHVLDHCGELGERMRALDVPTLVPLVQWRKRETPLHEVIDAFTVSLQDLDTDSGLVLPSKPGARNKNKTNNNNNNNNHNNNNHSSSGGRRKGVTIPQCERVLSNFLSAAREYNAAQVVATAPLRSLVFSLVNAILVLKSRLEEADASLSLDFRIEVLNALTAWLLDDYGRLIQDPFFVKRILAGMDTLIDGVDLPHAVVDKFFALLWDFVVFSEAYSHHPRSEELDVSWDDVRSDAIDVFQQFATNSLKYGIDKIREHGEHLFSSNYREGRYIMQLDDGMGWLSLQEFLAVWLTQDPLLDQKYLVQWRQRLDAQELLEGFYRCCETAKRELDKYNGKKVEKRVSRILGTWLRWRFGDFTSDDEQQGKDDAVSATLEYFFNSSVNIRWTYDDLKAKFQTASEIVTGFMKDTAYDPAEVRLCLMVYQWFMSSERFFGRMMAFLRDVQQQETHASRGDLLWAVNVKAGVLCRISTIWCNQFGEDWDPTRSRLLEQWREFKTMMADLHAPRGMEEEIAAETQQKTMMGLTATLDCVELVDDMLEQAMEHVLLDQFVGKDEPVGDNEDEGPKAGILQGCGMLPGAELFAAIRPRIGWHMYDTMTAVAAGYPVDTRPGFVADAPAFLSSDTGYLIVLATATADQMCNSFCIVDQSLFDNLRLMIASTFRQGSKWMNPHTCNGESIVEWKALVRHGLDDQQQRRAGAMRRFVCTVLVEANATDDRRAVLTRLIDIAAGLKKRRNYNAFALLVQALGHPSVQALEKSWELKKASKKLFAKLQEYCSPEHNYHCLRTAFEKSQKRKEPGVPYFGTLDVALFQIGEQGDKLQSESRRAHVGEDGMKKSDTIQWTDWRELAVKLDDLTAAPPRYMLEAKGGHVRFMMLVDPMPEERELLDRMEDLHRYERDLDNLFLLDLLCTADVDAMDRGQLSRHLHQHLTSISIHSGTKSKIKDLVLVCGREEEGSSSKAVKKKKRRSLRTDALCFLPVEIESDYEAVVTHLHGLQTAPLTCISASPRIVCAWLEHLHLPHEPVEEDELLVTNA